MIVQKSIAFQASKAQVWDLLTNPALTQQYMFGCEVLSDWQVGSAVNWKGKNEAGEDVVFVKGVVTEIVEGEKVTFTMLDPNVGIVDIPENYAKLTYWLETMAEGTTLHLTQDFTGTENGQQRYEESLGGWDHVIGLMKKLVE